jgi:hypothetical protein
MSKQREALESILQMLGDPMSPLEAKIIVTAYEALVEPEQKPVGIVRTVGGYPDDSTHTVEWLVKHKELRDGDKLYASPQTRKPLTDERIDALELPPSGTAAAPDLLEALEALIEDQRDASLPVLAQARAAIAKAKGKA